MSVIGYGNASAGTNATYSGIPQNTVIQINASFNASCNVWNGWTGDVANASAMNTTVTMNATKTITANCTCGRSLTVNQSASCCNVTVEGYGTVPGGTSNTFNVTCNATINVSAAFNASCDTWNGWTGNVSNTSAMNTTVTMNASKTITANCSYTPYVYATGVGLWKWSANPPSDEEVCNGGGNGSATRGSVDFMVDCTKCPRTITVTITVTSGPKLEGDNARDVFVMESNPSMNPTCLNPNVTSDVSNSIGRFDAPNNTPVTLGPIDVYSCATRFALILLETGGGGTDTYTTGTVELVCPSLPPCALPYEGWRYRMRFNVTDNGSGLTDYWVPINLSTTTFDYTKANASGADLRFTEDDRTTTLNYSIQTWNTSGNSTVWVKLNVSANSTETFFMHYGNPCVGNESIAGNYSMPQPPRNLGEEEASHIRTDYFGGTVGILSLINTIVSDGSVLLPLNYTHIYNYSGVTTVGPHDAYECIVDDWVLAPTGVNLNSKTEAADAYYTAISTSDDARWLTSAPGLFNEVFLWCNMSINESRTAVTNISLLYEGYANDGASTVRMWIFNASNSSWEILSPDASFGAGVDSTMIRWKNSSCANYIDSGGILQWGVSQNLSESTMLVDYVQATITYSYTVGNVTSTNVSLGNRSRWSMFYATNQSLVTGTNISYQVRASNNSVLCNITAAQAEMGYNISGCAGNVSLIRLYANLSTTNTSVTPYLHKWSVSRQ